MNPVSALIFIIFVGGAVLSFLARMPLGITIVLALIGIFLGYSVKMAQQWEKAVILRLGKLQAVKGPGLFILVPIFDQVAMWIDQRIRTSEFSAEQALTRDTVPVNVDAIVFWMVHDAERAALEIVDYNSAVQRVAQTSLREMIGSSVLSELLSERKEADATLKAVIGAKTAEWGVTVNSVEIRDVAIPANLQDAMSRQAQAEREKQARVILGSAEEEIGAEIRQCRQALCLEPRGAAAARHEHHLRNHQGARRHHPDADIDGGCDESRRRRLCPQHGPQRCRRIIRAAAVRPIGAFGGKKWWLRRDVRWYITPGPETVMPCRGNFRALWRWHCCGPRQRRRKSPPWRWTAMSPIRRN